MHALRDFVEQGQAPDATEDPEESYEVLRESPILGDGKFKLEIGGGFQQQSTTNLYFVNFSSAQCGNSRV